LAQGASSSELIHFCFGVARIVESREMRRVVQAPDVMPASKTASRGAQSKPFQRSYKPLPNQVRVSRWPRNTVSDKSQTDTPHGDHGPFRCSRAEQCPRAGTRRVSKAESGITSSPGSSTRASSADSLLDKSDVLLRKSDVLLRKMQEEVDWGDEFQEGGWGRQCTA